MSESEGDHQRRCETCLFSSSPNWETINGVCLRYPPVLDIAYLLANPQADSASNESAWLFPLVVYDDWCGEWQPKPTAG